MSIHPTLKWAQRSDKVYITTVLPDAEDIKLKLEPQGKFFLSATSGANKTPYEVDLDLLDNVDVNSDPPLFFKVDWDKWVDEDEVQEGGADMDFGDFDFNSLNMGDSEGIGDEVHDIEEEIMAETKEVEKIVEEGNGDKDEGLSDVS